VEASPLREHGRLPVRVFTPESPIRHPRRMVADALRDLRVARSLAWRLAVRDISAQYRQTALGYLWSVLPAVMLTLVWVVLNKSTLVRISTGAIPYAVFALTGTIFWQLFLDAMNAPLAQVTGNRTMLVRVRFPPEALLLSGLLQVAFSFLIKLVLLGLVLAAYGGPIRWTAVFVLVPASAFIVIGTVVGVTVTPLGALYKDIQQALLAIVTPLLFLTPVVYPPPATGLIATLMRYNPLTPLFQVTRSLLYGGGDAPVARFVAVYAVALALALGGWFVLRLVMPLIVERLEA